MNELEQHRLAKHRLAILRHADEVSGSIAATCRYYGISRTRFYRWQQRYAEQGLVGLQDRSKRPHHCPHATSDEVIGKIIHLRQHYHFGPLKISMYLKRYHDIEVSQSGVWRILKRLDMNRLPSSQRHKPLERHWKRYEKQQPGQRIQIDALDPSNVAHYLTAITQAAGLGHWHPHELRHSAASLLLAQGVPLKVVSDILGHASINITADIYAHILAPAKDDAAAAMDRALTAQ